MNGLLCEQYNYHKTDDNKIQIYDFDELYPYDQFDSKFKISKGLGNGYIRRILFEDSLEIVEFNMVLNQQMKIQYIKKKPLLEIFICIEGNIKWDDKCIDQLYSLKEGDTFICFNCDCDSIIDCDRGERIKAVKIQLSDNFIRSFEKYLSDNQSDKKNWIKIKDTTPQLSLICKQVINSLYKKQIDKIYVKGKVLELAALYFNQLIPKRSKIKDIVLSKTDIASLYKAKNILDDNIVNPPYLKELSKMVYLNEYKLKNGFKFIFGKPVYSYVKEQKLDLARFIFEDKKLLVNEVAGLIGYKNVSHFTNAFRKKYGVTAGEYRKKYYNRNF